MKNTPSHSKLAEDLIRQDPGLSEAQIQEHRARVVGALERAERLEKLVRRGAIISCVLLVIMVVLMSAVLVLYPAGRVIGGVITFVLLVVSGALLSLYNDKYRPAVTARREDIQTAVLAGLQRQVEEIKNQQSKESRE